MHLDREACYRALKTRDPRFDGRIFVGVRTTGIYCRPVCPARCPRLENIDFYPSAAAAQEAGLRPCLRCRPECAPDLAAWKGTSVTIARALALIDGGALDGDEADVEGLASRLGIGERQLRRLFRKHLGASPVAVAQTRRVLLAKQLVQETRMGMTEVAHAAGFGSLRRFHDTFRKLYGRAPSTLRRGGAGPGASSDGGASPATGVRASRGSGVPAAAGVHGARGSDRAASGSDDASSSGGFAAEAGIRLRLPYSPPYDWCAMEEYLAGRALDGVEVVEPGLYRRAIALDGRHGVVEVRPLPGASALEATIRFPDVRALPAILSRLRRVFDVGADVAAIARHLSADLRLGPLVHARPGLRVPGAWDGFETAVRTVVGQQVSVRGARTVLGRIVERWGAPLECPVGGVSRVFPSPEVLAVVDADEIARLGMPGRRAECVRALAALAAGKRDLFDPAKPADENLAMLRSVPGIGEWTADYVAMRVLREPDAFPASDLGLLRAMQDEDGRRPSVEELKARAKAWRPWRAYAAQQLWVGAVDPAEASGGAAPVAEVLAASRATVGVAVPGVPHRIEARRPAPAPDASKPVAPRSRAVPRKRTKESSR